MPEQLEAPTLSSRVHLDRLFKKLTPQSVMSSEVKDRSIEEQQAVLILRTPTVRSKIDRPAQCHPVPRPKYAPHSGSILLTAIVGIHLQWKSKDGSLRLPMISRKPTNGMARFQGATGSVRTQQLNQIHAVVPLNVVAAIGGTKQVGNRSHRNLAERMNDSTGSLM